MKKIALFLSLLFLCWPWKGTFFQAVADVTTPSTSGTSDTTSNQTQDSRDAKIKDLEVTIEKEQQIIEELKQRVEALEKKEATTPTSPPPASATGPQPVMVSKPGVKLNLYGFVEATGISDTNPLFPDDLAGPFWALSPNDPTFKKQTSGSVDFTAQYSRVGLEISAPPTGGGWKPTGKVEMDFNGSLTASPFQDAFSRSQMIPRLRLAFAKITKGDWNLEIGQDWEAIRQNLPVVFTSEDPFLDSGEVGYRRPLIRAAYLPKTGFQAMLDAGLMDALSNANLDAAAGDIFRNGQMSTRPLYELRLGYAWPSSVKTPYSFALWGARGWEKTVAGTVAGLTDFNMKVMGADFTLPFASWFQLKGKAWTGSNLADVRGAIGQGINTLNGANIGARGGWIQAGVGFTPHYWVWIGDSVDNPFYGDLNNAPAAFTGSNGFPLARVRNSFFSLTQIWNLGPTTDIGLEYFYHNTYYKIAPTGVDSRIQFSAHQLF